MRELQVSETNSSSQYEPSLLFIMQHGDVGVLVILHNVILMMSGRAVMGVLCELDGADDWIPIRTLRGLQLRKSNIELQSVVLKPRVFSFPVSFMAMIVSNAELKSPNSILMRLFFFSRCIRLSAGQWIWHLPWICWL